MIVFVDENNYYFCDDVMVFGTACWLRITLLWFLLLVASVFFKIPNWDPSMRYWGRKHNSYR